jgi:hypothetical protein
MNTKCTLGLLMVLAVACKDNSGVGGGGEGGTTAGGGNRGRTDAGAAGTGGTIATTGGSADFDGGAVGGELPGAAGTGGLTGGGGTGGLTGVGGTITTGGMGTAGIFAIGGTGGFTGSSASSPTCPNGTACGGDLVGTWQVSSSCLVLSGDMDIGMVGLGCRTVPVTGSVQVTGAWTAKSDGTYIDATTTKGSMTFPLAPACISAFSTTVRCSDVGAVFSLMGWTDTMCSQTGDQCFCKAQTTLVGALGLPSPFASDTGDYTISNGELRVDEENQYLYCVAGSKLTLTPKPTPLPVKGTIVLQRSGGAGGAGGSSGATGGTAGSGGAKGGAGGTSKTGTGGVTGGAGGTSKAGSTGSSAGACASSAACGGDVVGTWEVKSSCLKASGQADMSFTGLECPTAEITGSANVTGTLTLTAAGKYTDQTITSGSDTWVLDAKCQVLSGTRISCQSMGTFFTSLLSSYGYQSFSCVDQATGGCLCQGAFSQVGGMGMLVMDPYSPSNYKLSGNTLTRDDNITYSYCVTGKQMTASPQPTNTSGPPYKGTIVLQKLGAGPDGGAP